MSEPTPRPWRNGDAALHVERGNILAGRARLVANCLGHAGNSSTDTLGENQANAALIVRAVNSHDRLLAAAKAAEKALATHHEAYVGAIETCDYCNALAELRAAIAEAEGQE